MAPRPKQFVAACDFIYRNRSYRKGEPITHQWTLGQLLRYGDKFATTNTKADPETGEADVPKED